MTDPASSEPAIARLDDTGAHCLPTPAQQPEPEHPEPVARADIPFGFPLGPQPTEPETGSIDGLASGVTTDTAPDSGPFFLSVLNGSKDCIKILRRDGTLEFMNANGICLMEIDDFAPLKGKSWVSLWPQESRKILGDAIDDALQGRHSRFEALCPTAKGTLKYWDVTVSPVNGASGVEWLVSISRDITERVLSARSLDTALQEQKRLSEALERNQQDAGRSHRRSDGGVARERSRALRDGGGARAIAENGCRRQSDGRRRARFQQRAASHRRESAARRAGSRWERNPDAAPDERARSGRARRETRVAIAGVRAPAAARTGGA